MRVELILLMLVSTSSGIPDACDFPIRRSRVLSSWQSSFEFIINAPTCFYHRSQSDEDSILNNKYDSYRFFHSQNKLQADGGFHWFAVQLNETVLIRSVTVKGREDGDSYVYQRAAGIEIWTSGSSSQMFSGDHCSSRSLGKQFNESRQHWRLCGVTESNNSEITAGEIFTVNCVAEVRQLLLRRDITQANVSSYHDTMSFADLRLQTVQLEPSAPQLVAESSSFSLSCALKSRCKEDTNSSGLLQLCFPNGSCTAEKAVRIPRAQPQDAGSYTCRLGSVEERTAVTVLSSSQPQLVAENSSFSVSCSLHCSGSELRSNSRGLQLCFPNGSCTAEHNFTVAGALPQHSGNYSCKLDAAVKRTAVTVLSSSEHQVVAENSSFSVSCSLHCSGSELCSNSSGLQLCFPNGSCTTDTEVAVAGAQPHHSGNYSCKLGAVGTQTSVTVLYPPSKVFITLLNFKSCQNLSDLTVQFTCSASVPVPEHSCMVEAGGVAVQNLTRLSQSSSRDGSVSQWKLDRDGEQSLESRFVINCSAVQQLPHFSFRQDTVEVNYCSDPSNASSPFGVAASILSGVGLSLCAALIVVVVLRKTQCKEPSAVSRLNVNSTHLVNSKLRVEESPLPEAAIGDSELECSYLTVEAAAPAGLQAELQDSASDCTEFIEILTDGD